MNGVSVIICCYNSQNRILTTLEHISKLNIERINCELILIDNNCTDNTAVLSENIWKDLKSPFPLSIYSEKRPGLSSAREKGIEQSKYDIILFCDDDNWLNQDYLKTVMAFFSEKDKAAVVAGVNHPVFESAPPSWFYEFQYAYAAGSIGNSTADVTHSRGHVWGAGMAFRKKIYIELKNAGFNFISSDRNGKTIESGGDTELCFAFKSLGYQIWNNTDLSLQHYIPKSRISPEYIKKLFRSFGAFATIFDAYSSTYQNVGLDWRSESKLILKEILRQKKNFLKVLFTKEINTDLLKLEQRYGKLKRLILLKEKYNRYPEEVKAIVERANLNKAKKV